MQRIALYGLLALARPRKANGGQIVPREELAYSPPFYPSPWMNPKALGWEEAYVKAKDFVSQLTLLEKVNLTTGVGYVTIQSPGYRRANRNTAGKANNAWATWVRCPDWASEVFACKIRPSGFASVTMFRLFLPGKRSRPRSTAP